MYYFETVAHFILDTSLTEDSGNWPGVNDGEVGERTETSIPTRTVICCNVGGRDRGSLRCKDTRP
jgi:hypothetical protein